MLAPSHGPQRSLAQRAAHIAPQCLGVMLAWVLLYEFNMWAFDSLAVNPFVSWIFLPAFIRMVSVLLFGWAGVAGLILGALLTSPPTEIGHSLPLAFISGFAPMLAFKICQSGLKLNTTLEGLRASDLLILALVGSFICVTLNGVYFAHHHLPADLLTCLTPMFLGDMMGNLMMLYLAAIVLRAITRLQHRSAEN
jgi:hypothetical protein